MDKESTQRLLNIISTLDNRIVTEAMTESWTTVLSDTTFEDAMERVGKFFRSGVARRLTVQDVVTPDEQPDDNAWMDRSHERPTAGQRWTALRSGGATRDEAIDTLNEEGYILSPEEELLLIHQEPTA